MNNNTYFDLTIQSPGRINLIGEHIDYNGGFVLPAAIDKHIEFSFRKNGTDIATVYSKNIDSSFQINLNAIEKSAIAWHNYILGVLFQIELLKPGSIKGFDCAINSNLPLGSGLSSSAALECGLAKGLNELFTIGLTDLEIIKLARDAEHSMVGTQCGIMDQFAVMMGKKDHFLLLNCKNLECQLVEADLGAYKLLLLNSNVSHNLATSEYNTRRAECDAALKIIKEEHSQYKFLCDVQPEVIHQFKDQLPEKVFNRALYASEENKRVLKAINVLESGDIQELGMLLYESHEGLRSQYEVSCKELDFLVDYTKNLDPIAGARMMGGGFGGCTINLVHKDYIDQFIEDISTAYKENFNLEPTPIAVHLSDGVLKI